LAPNHPDGLHFLALACLKENDVNRALELLDTLVKTSPERWEAWMELGKLYQSLGHDDDAIAAYTKAAANATDQAGIWNTIGILLTNRKDFPEALKAFKKAAGFDYSDAQIQGNLKAVQKKIDSTCQRVIEANSESLAKDPNQLDAYLEMGKAYELLERPEEALMAYQRLLSLRPDSVDGLMAYAELLKKRGRLKMAIRCYREILKIQHNHIEARLELVKANLNLGFLNEALRHAVVAQKTAPDDPRVHFLLGKIYFSKGLAPRALKEFTFVANNSRDPDIIGWAELMRRRLQRSV
jgi:tetratricopeptide (TPR) repeat protein